MTALVPRNRTARAAALGNPASARLESGVGNCFPGLEMDVRNLEGRFFPGLVFWVVTEPLAPVPEAPPNQAGIRLKYLDYLQDPLLPERSTEPWVQTLLATYTGSTGVALSNGRWYLHWLEQGGHRVSCYQSNGQPYDGELLWRFVRCLSADQPLKIALVQRDGPDPKPVVELDGWRRRYTTPVGVIDSAYPAGELTQTMCNPWQHDFRDCACYYWASNHPDVVLGDADGRSLPDGEPAGTTAANTLLDWLRRDRSPAGAVAAPESRAAARPAQIDHFEINRRWQDLAFVVGGREIGAVYAPSQPDKAPPYASAAEMIDELENRLAPLELTLALQYLYAFFSMHTPAEAPADRWPTMTADLTMARQFVTLVAVGEMTHLRWANQMLWELDRAGFYPPGRRYSPVLKLVSPAISLGGIQVPSLRAMDLQTLDAFIFIERPGGAIDTAYARCVSTLEQPNYPRHLYELAVRIDTDGNQHFERFRDVRQAFGTYAGAPGLLPVLRDMHVGSREETAAALDAVRAMIEALREAYAAEAAQQLAPAQAAIDRARALMVQLHAQAEALGARGIGINFLDAV